MLKRSSLSQKKKWSFIAVVMVLVLFMARKLGTLARDDAVDQRAFPVSEEVTQTFQQRGRENPSCVVDGITERCSRKSQGTGVSGKAVDVCHFYATWHAASPRYHASALEPPSPISDTVIKNGR